MPQTFGKFLRKTADQIIVIRAVVRGGAGGALAPPEFGVSDKRTERELDSLLLLAPPDLKT